MVLSQDIFDALIGAATLAGTLYGYARIKGFKLLDRTLEGLPAELERIKRVAEAERKALEADLATTQNEINTAKGNITLSELADIVYTAEQYSKGGFTAAEAEALGKKIIDAAASK